jgi:hypothetical protein
MKPHTENIKILDGGVRTKETKKISINENFKTFGQNQKGISTNQSSRLKQVRGYKIREFSLNIPQSLHTRFS